MATFIPANVEIPYAGLANGAVFNDDGHGWAVASAGLGIEVGKSMKFETAIRDFGAARAKHGIGSVALFHSRFATHGTVNEYNVHPFFADETTVVAHNGVLPKLWLPAKHDRRSDTRVLVDRTIPRFLNPDTGIPSRQGGKELGELIGSGNKLVIISMKSGAPRVRIINAYLGTHSDGVWYSNDGFCPIETRYSNWTSFGGSYADDKASFDGEHYSTLKCDRCMERGFINMDTDQCEWCDTCQSCWADSNICECYWRTADEGVDVEGDAPLDDGKYAEVIEEGDGVASMALVPWTEYK